MLQIVSKLAEHSKALSSANCQQSFSMACRSVGQNSSRRSEATEILLRFTAVDEQIDINITNRMEIYDAGSITRINR